MFDEDWYIYSAFLGVILGVVIALFLL